MALGSSSASSSTVMRGIQYNGEGYAPGHITGFFTIHMTGDPLSSGSTGAGLCLKEGVITEVTAMESDKAELTLESNGVPVQSSPTCDSVLNKLFYGRPMRVVARQTSNLPAGYGYAVSGASALSLAIAVNQALDLNLTKREAGEVAHTAEVENLTGLGDVSAQLLGGLVVRQRPGAPGFGEARCLPSPNDHVVVTSPVAQFPTSRMITEEQYVKRINYLGESAMSSFLPSPGIDNLMRQSKIFWEGVGIQKDRVQQTIKLFESAGVPSPSAKKGVVFGVIPRDNLKKVLPRLAPHFKLNGDPPPVIRDPSSGLTVIISEISTRGAC